MKGHINITGIVVGCGVTELAELCYPEVGQWIKDARKQINHLGLRDVNDRRRWGKPSIVNQSHYYIHPHFPGT